METEQGSASLLALLLGGLQTREPPLGTLPSHMSPAVPCPRTCLSVLWLSGSFAMAALWPGLGEELPGVQREHWVGWTKLNLGIPPSLWLTNSAGLTAPCRSLLHVVCSFAMV